MNSGFCITPVISGEKLHQLEEMAGQFGSVMKNRTKVIKTDFPASFGSMLGADSGLEYNEVVQAIKETRQTGGFIRIFISSKQREIQNLPWELLFHENSELGFLSRNPLISIIRIPGMTGNIAKTQTSPLLPSPIRILSIVSSPEGTSGRRLDYEKELEVCFLALDERIQKSEAQIHVMEDACLETLEKRMSKHDYHVIHISCHDCTKEGEPALLFEEEKTWMQRPVTGRELTDVFVRAGKRTPCLFISACNSVDDMSGDSVTGVAQTLLDYGIQNVMVMKYPVSDSKAMELARMFYYRLSGKKDVASSLSLARAAVSDKDMYSEWTVPVLYAGSADTAIIDREKESGPFRRTDTQQCRAEEISLLKHGFIGRRRVVRELFRCFTSGKTPHLFFTGTGGAGKTAMAGHFAFSPEHEKPGLKILGYRAPFTLERFYEKLLLILDDLDETNFAEIIKSNPIEAQVLRMLHRISGRILLCIILDNIENYSWYHHPSVEFSVKPATQNWGYHTLQKPLKSAQNSGFLKQNKSKPLSHTTNNKENLWQRKNLN